METQEDWKAVMERDQRERNNAFAIRRTMGKRKESHAKYAKFAKF